MAKVKYIIRENTKLKPHSFYAQAINTGTLTYDEVCEKACKKTNIEPSAMRAAVTEYMDKVQELLLMGYRVPLGDQFLFLYPSINVSVKDQVNETTGEVIKPATADMVKVSSAVGKVGASVSPKFSKRFDLEVGWQRVDDKGQEVADEEDATTPGGTTPGTNDGTTPGGNDSGGNQGGTTPGGNDDGGIEG